MARTKTISYEQILEAAHEVFLEQGISGTTAEIARRAGISEGSIFRRYPTKHALFIAALGIPTVPPFISVADELVGQGDLRENLHRICIEIHQFVKDTVPKMVMLASCRVSPLELLTAHDTPAPLLAIQGLTTFIKREQELGRAKRIDPEIVGRIMLGSLFHHAFFEEMKLNKRLSLSPDDFMDGLVDVVWSALRPDEEGQ